MSSLVPTRAASDPSDLWRATLSGFCASLVGIGLARFAYTPLLPAIIAGGWFSASSAAYLGAANLAGYLLGALGANALARRVAPRVVLRAGMAAAAVAFIACAWPVGFGWFFAWRLVSGVAGGLVMVLAAPTILAHAPAERRGLVSGAIFMGIGFGVAASGTLAPLLLRRGLTAAWIGLGVISLILTLVGWNGWPAPVAPAASGAQPARPSRAAARQLRAVYLGYGLNAFGLVPHMVFLVDFVARGLGQGLDLGTRQWVLFGLGAAAGPLALGHLGDRIGARTALRLVFALEAVFVALPVFGVGTWLIALSSLVVGACTIGIVPVTLARTREILGDQPAAQTGAWRTATTAFALFQAAGAYGLSFLFARSGGDYRLLFGLGAGAMAAALMVDLAAPRSEAPQNPKSLRPG